MIDRILNWLLWHLLVVSIALICVQAAAGQTRSPRKHRSVPVKATETKPSPDVSSSQIQVAGHRIKFADGSSMDADEVWKQGDDYWYRIGGVSQRMAREVRGVDTIQPEPEKKVAANATSATLPEGVEKTPSAFWILLKGGARMKVDDVIEKADGAWYRRATVSMFLERDRIECIERDSGVTATVALKQRDWTTGNSGIDELIRNNGVRFGIDPYLIFCVMEHESHFHPRAISPKGARGLMQLMPGTAARFGVRRPFDPAQNIFGGTQYLKELLGMFGGRLDLALASYNAGEGAVIKYGGHVPPYRETREYVRRVTQRYSANAANDPDKVAPAPR